jgi:UDP-N-acetylglucosamine/UDP-N-acetylgalactosamine diphosphorylase
MLETWIREQLFGLGQEHLLIGIERLSSAELQRFADQLQRYAPLLAKQQEALHRGKSFTDFRPYSNHTTHGDLELGESFLRQGKVGCLILAGGQGTRLGFDGPKGSYPVSLIRQKSLFQLFCERTRAASAWSGYPLPICIMTSAVNHAQTLAFFEQHGNFGLAGSQLSFIQQQMLPFLDDRGHWLLEAPGKIAEGPDGNGQALSLFYNCGLWEKWRACGIEYLNVIFVDNALADPFDAEFVGYTASIGADATLKALERKSADEKMGVLAECAGKLKVIEYSELPADASQFTLSSTGMFCISMQFIGKLDVEFPLHVARKKAPVLLGQEMAQIWKCERFIFDLLDHARTTGVLVCPREKIYAPLKNASGDRSIESVRHALLLHDQQTYCKLTGVQPQVSAFELDPVYYYPSEGLKEKLKQLKLSEEEYIS